MCFTAVDKQLFYRQFPRLRRANRKIQDWNLLGPYTLSSQVITIWLVLRFNVELGAACGQQTKHISAFFCFEPMRFLSESMRVFVIFFCCGSCEHKRLGCFQRKWPQTPMTNTLVHRLRSAIRYNFISTNSPVQQFFQNCDRHFKRCRIFSIRHGDIAGYPNPRCIRMTWFNQPMFRLVFAGSMMDMEGLKTTNFWTDSSGHQCCFALETRLNMRCLVTVAPRLMGKNKAAMVTKWSGLISYACCIPLFVPAWFRLMGGQSSYTISKPMVHEQNW